MVPRRGPGTEGEITPGIGLCGCVPYVLESARDVCSCGCAASRRLLTEDCSIKHGYCKHGNHAPSGAAGVDAIVGVARDRRQTYMSMGGDRVTRLSTVARSVLLRRLMRNGRTRGPQPGIVYRVGLPAQRKQL